MSFFGIAIWCIQFGLNFFQFTCPIDFSASFSIHVNELIYFIFIHLYVMNFFNYAFIFDNFFELPAIVLIQHSYLQNFATFSKCIPKLGKF